MRIVYAGTPDFAVKPLEAIVNAGYEVVAVVTQKDKKVGRKQILTPPPVKSAAEKLGIKVFQYDKIRTEGTSDLSSLAPDLMITCAFGQILSQEILDIPKMGVINIHASLLPKYRGASPVQQCILNGDKETGITVMKTDVGIDTGDIILQEKLSIGEYETAGELFERLSVLGAESVLKTLELIDSGKAVYTSQGDNFTYAKMINKEDAKIDFDLTTDEIINKIRAYNPSPVAYCNLNGETLKIFSAVINDKKFSTVGKVEIADAKQGLVVSTKDGAVEITELQIAGGKKMAAKAFLLGRKIAVGEKL